MPWYDVELERDGQGESASPRIRKVSVRASDEETAGLKALAENADYSVRQITLPMSQTPAFRFMALCFAAVGLFIVLLSAGVIK